MAKDPNPFVRAISPKTDAKREAVDEAASEIRSRHTDDELTDPTNEASNQDDTPSAVEDNQEESDQAGADLGLGSFEFTSAKDRVNADVDDSSGDPAPTI